MRRSPISLVSVVTAAVATVALSFGAVQAAASPSTPAVKGCDLRACFNACQERYGEGTQVTCDKWGNCVCIL